MNLLSNNAANIPLHCNVCPKKPDFSDVSHLLTHVASKGHLSAYYKLKVKGSTDDEAKQAVDDYDEWYEEFNLEELMRDRMSQKEKKKKRGGRSFSHRASGAATTNPGLNTSSASTARGARSIRLRDNAQLLDPHLGHRLRSEPLSRSATPQSAYSMDTAGFQRALAHGMQNWAPSGISYDNSPLIKQENLDSDYSDDDDDYASIEYPPRRKPRGRRHHIPSVSVGSFEETSVDDLANDSTKLKGVYWPGMDMFDSATPEARRKRNQKKNVSVLRSLQATSEYVQPKEWVHDAGVVFRKEREITGNVDSEDSLIEGESEPEPEIPKKKRATRRSRPALVEKDVNSRRVLRDRGQSHHPPFSRKVKKPYFKEEEDDDLTYGPPSKKRMGLSIHRDHSGPNITFDQPAPMNYLTSGFRSPFQPNLIQPQQGYHNDIIPRAHSRQQSWGQLNGGFRPTASMSNQSFPHFGQYLSNSLGTVNQPAFQHHLGMGSQVLQNNHSMLPMQPGTTWDFLGLDNDDLGMLTNTSNPFQFNGEMTAANPLFFGNTKEDDEATISAADEDH